MLALGGVIGGVNRVGHGILSSVCGTCCLAKQGSGHASLSSLVLRDLPDGFTCQPMALIVWFPFGRKLLVRDLESDVALMVSLSLRIIGEKNTCASILTCKDVPLGNVAAHGLLGLAGRGSLPTLVIAH